MVQTVGAEASERESRADTLSGTIGSIAAFLVILNPFALCLYLSGVIEDLGRGAFFRVVIQASLISAAAFTVFAIFGEQVLWALGIQAGALRLFGGLIFLIIAYKYVSQGHKAAEMLRGSLDELPSAIAVPFMIGAGTITQAILIGKQFEPIMAAGILFSATGVSLCIIGAYYLARLRIRHRYERLFDRYIDLMARLNGLVIGAFSVDMVFGGARTLLQLPVAS